MRITNVEAFLVGGDRRNYFFVAIDTDEGISGVGEGGITHRELACAGMLEHMKPLLIGQDPTRIEHHWQGLFRLGSFPANKIAGSVASAVDIALWDILGKALGVPVYKLLGGAVRDRVVCYPHNAMRGEAVEPLVESCLATKAEGWKFVRWDLPTDDDVLEPRRAIRAALRQMEAVREAVGDEVEICFDVHTRLDPSDAIAFCQEARRFRPYFVEDPIRAENPGSYRLIRQHAGVPIATGELCAGKWEFRELIEEDLIDYCRLDVCVAGGITESKKIAGWCETHHIKLATHNPLGPVSSAACLHLNLACSNVGVQEQPRRPGTTLTDVFPVQIEWRDGYLLPPTRPGLGIELDRDAARRHLFSLQMPPRLWRLDGSMTNF